jgi:general secretion pathway protein G
MRSPRLLLLLVACLAALASCDRRAPPPCERARLQLVDLDAALRLYHAKHGDLPAPSDWLAALKREGILDPEMRDQDPWGSAYAYQPALDGSFDLRSIGPDGVPGTSDDQIKANGWAWRECRGDLLPFVRCAATGPLR